MRVRTCGEPRTVSWGDWRVLVYDLRGEADDALRTVTDWQSAGVRDRRLPTVIDWRVLVYDLRGDTNNSLG